MIPVKFGVGQPMTRKEDDALIRGAGRYIADFAPEGTLRGVVVRSPQAHAKFRITGAVAARKMPGVKLVLTGEETASLGNMPCTAGIPGVKLKVPPYPVLARDVVKHVGDAVAFVVAETVDQANDAAEALAIEWDSLPHIVGAVEALEAGAPLVWDDQPGNQAFEFILGDKAKTEAAFSKAARVIELQVVNQRLVTNYMDTRGALGEYDPAKDRYTVTLGSQGSHTVRDLITKRVLKIPAEKMRVITPDVGGGFGTKLFPYREYALVAVAAKETGRPVKWIAERTEHFLGDTQGRDNITTARIAVDDKGKFLALRIETVADMGSYLSTFAPYIPFIGAGMLPGVYDFPACYICCRAAYTNTVPVDAYRGAGRPEAAYVIERVVDAAARELELEPDELRRRNFIKPDAMPYETPTGKIYDTGEFAAHMARAQDVADWKGFKSRATKSKERGKLRGIGMATYIEACGGNGPESGSVTLEKDGSVTVLIGSQTTGQGHDTAYAQIIADQFGIPPERVRMHQGDTDRIKTGAGTGGSSSIPVGGVVVEGATKKLAENLKELAADALEASASDMEIADGTVRVAGTDRAISFPDLAKRAPDDKLTASDTFAPKDATYPNGTHITEIEIDEATGELEILNYVVVDDFGVTLNPLMLAGQVHGGAVQGLGQALMEETVYDSDSGQLVTATFMDYAVPRAGTMPPFVFETRNVPCKNNPMGFKGAGEAGAIGSCPAMMNAILNALAPYGVKTLDMPATAPRIWAALEEGKRRLRM